MDRFKVGDKVLVTFEEDPYVGECGEVIVVRPLVNGFTKADLKYIVRLENNGNTRVYTENELAPNMEAGTLRPPSGAGLCDDGGGVDGKGLPMDGGSLRAASGQMGDGA